MHLEEDPSSKELSGFFKSPIWFTKNKCGKTVFFHEKYHDLHTFPRAQMTSKKRIHLRGRAHITLAQRGREGAFCVSSRNKCQLLDEITG